MTASFSNLAMISLPIFCESIRDIFIASNDETVLIKSLMHFVIAALDSLISLPNTLTLTWA